MNSVFQTYSYPTSNDDVDYIVVDRSDDDDMDDYNDEDEYGNSSLVFACLEGKIDVVRALVDQGAFVNHQNQNGETPVYWAAAQGHEHIVDILIENGANLNVSNIDGASPAHVAAANGHRNVVEKLIRNGAFVNAQDEVKDSVLHYAVREGKYDVVEYLVKAGNARMDLRNEDYETPLDLAQCLEPSCGHPYDAIVKILQSIASGSHNQATKFLDAPISISMNGNKFIANDQTIGKLVY